MGKWIANKTASAQVLFTLSFIALALLVFTGRLSAGSNSEIATSSAEIAPTNKTAFQSGADLMPSFGDASVSAQSYLRNVEIEPLTLPQASGGDGQLAYILLPFLPAGLSFDPETLTLSGTPTEAIAKRPYTLSALDADGDFASLTFTLDVQMPRPDFNGDGRVDFADFLLFTAQFGLSQSDAEFDARFDLDGDGTIGFVDFLIFGRAFGN